MLLESDFNDDHKRMYEIMSDISEDNWCAGWIIGNEMSIWADKVNWPEELLYLHNKLQGWIIWAGEEYSITDYNGIAFVTTEEWSELQKVWLGGKTNGS